MQAKINTIAAWHGIIASVETKVRFLQKHPALKDILGLVAFIAAVALGTLILNTFVFRSYNVVGHSMDDTLHPGDRLIVNRLPVTWAHLQRKEYVPKRGQIIVFENPSFSPGAKDQYIVKRVIAFGGEEIELKDGKFTIYNDEHPDGFNPDDDFNGEPKSPTSHELDRTRIPEGELFVAGDNRVGNNSLDSRDGLGNVPLGDVVGPAGIRIFPLNKIRFF